MAFSSTDVLQEFVEASRTTRDWSADTEASLYQRALYVAQKEADRLADPWTKRCSRIRARKWYWDNAEYKKALERLKRASPEHRLRRQAYDKTPERVAKMAERHVRYNRSAEGKAVKNAWRAKMRLDPVWVAKIKEQRRASRERSKAKKADRG